jgi:hypothetical protein
MATAALLSGFALVIAAQRLAPISGPPLYDGVVVEDPYKWLSPPTGFPGGARSASASGSVRGSLSPDLSLGTPEQPPQAQVFAGQGYLAMPAGTTSISVSIAPVVPSAQPADGVIAGNVYRFSLTSQSGAAIVGQPDGGATIALRGPPNLASATIERLNGSTWSPLRTEPAGVPHMFTAVVTDFGDFALVAPSGWVPAAPGGNAPGPAGPGASEASPDPFGSAGSETTNGSGPSLLPIVAATLALMLVVAGVAYALRRKPIRPSGDRQPPRPGSARRIRKKPPRRRR